MKLMLLKKDLDLKMLELRLVIPIPVKAFRYRATSPEDRGKEVVGGSDTSDVHSTSKDDFVRNRRTIAFGRLTFKA